MSFLTREDSFWEEASALLYDWLSEDDRWLLRSELYEEDIADLRELSPNIRFFRLLHFVQVKYIRVEEWVDAISGFVETINSKNPDATIEGIILEDEEGKEVSLRQIRREVHELRPQAVFGELLETLELQEEYSLFLQSLKKGEI